VEDDIPGTGSRSDHLVINVNLSTSPLIKAASPATSGGLVDRPHRDSSSPLFGSADRRNGLWFVADRQLRSEHANGFSCETDQPGHYVDIPERRWLWIVGPITGKEYNQQFRGETTSMQLPASPAWTGSQVGIADFHDHKFS